ncbi:MAG: ArsR family transcriptional regulator [Rhodobacteraceae bacterium]|nr:MAG: ArsR family transcriptional regulator [Paracoccaceae bacterium]
MREVDAAAKLAALGHEARLGVFRLLVRAGPEGVSIGEIGRLAAMAPSTLAHHLGALVSAGLVTQEKRGRETINRAEFAAMHALLAFVQEECCAGVAREAGTAA